jgi:hypothetical protein
MLEFVQNSVLSLIRSDARANTAVLVRLVVEHFFKVVVLLGEQSNRKLRRSKWVRKTGIAQHKTNKLFQFSSSDRNEKLLTAPNKTNKQTNGQTASKQTNLNMLRTFKTSAAWLWLSVGGMLDSKLA